MDRELVLVTLALALAGPAAWACSWWRGGAPALPSGRDLEWRAWRQLWAPLMPAAFLLAVLAGWALLEPDDAESVPWTIFAAAAPFAFVVARAAVRFARTAMRGAGDVPAATVGFFRPRVIVSNRLAESLERDALEAACAHERAHAAHLDPLRIWLARLATDLQWPWLGAFERLRRWQRALELARDEEARAHGARGEDLAEAVIAATRIASAGAGAMPMGMLTGDEAALKDRVERLLAPLPVPELEGPRRRLWIPLIAAALGLAVVIGATLGEATVRAVLATVP